MGDGCVAEQVLQRRRRRGYRPLLAAEAAASPHLHFYAWSSGAISSTSSTEVQAIARGGHGCLSCSHPGDTGADDAVYDELHEWPRQQPRTRHRAISSEEAEHLSQAQCVW